MEFSWCIVIGLVLVASAYCRSTKNEYLPVTLYRQKVECLYGGNKVRQTFTATDLKWNNDLVAGAEDWAIRCAMKNRMEFNHKGLGENLYMTFGKATCSKPMFSWYQSYTKFNYNKPKWTTQNGVFLQHVYDKVHSLAVGMAEYDGKVYVVGRYDYGLKIGDPLDIKHVHKPVRKLSESDLIPSPNPKIAIEIPVPNVEGWSDWVDTTKCSANCGKGTKIQERFCFNLSDKVTCSGNRKRTVTCSSGIACIESCNDRHKDCIKNAKKDLCNNPQYDLWMMNNCPFSCGYCRENEEANINTIAL